MSGCVLLACDIVIDNDFLVVINNVLLVVTRLLFVDLDSYKFGLFDEARCDWNVGRNRSFDE